MALNLPYFTPWLWRFFQYIFWTLESGFALWTASPSSIMIIIISMLRRTTTLLSVEFPIFSRWRFSAPSSIPTILSVSFSWPTILCIFNHSGFCAIATIRCRFGIAFVFHLIIFIFWRWIIVTKAPKILYLWIRIVFEMLTSGVDAIFSQVFHVLTTYLLWMTSESID